MARTDLVIQNIKIAVENKPIVHGVSLRISPGKIHVIMGPNGSGKSTLASTLMGHPSYTVTGGSAKIGRTNLLDLPPEERAKRGLFLAFQYPLEIAGVSLSHFLRTAYNASHTQASLSMLEFRRILDMAMKELKMDATFASRDLNAGFSGGEKKKAEVLQMRVLKPRFVLCDETDSGLDIDALKIVARGIKKTVEEGAGALVITHYPRLLDYLQPDVVSVMVDGRIVDAGESDLVKAIERGGYEQYRKVAHA
ncbi:MAG: Fe-S cluster assembly ATPase SufC [bacterium]|nr:Fe-S cluster assembly ATPase SufC [bacterium]